MSIINRFQTSAQEVSDRTRRLGYSGGVPNMIMDAKKSGLDCNPIRGGTLLMHLPGRDGYLGGLRPDGRYQQSYVDMMPTDYQFLVNKRFRESDDMAYRKLDMLAKLPYELPPNPPVAKRNMTEYQIAEINKARSEYDKTYTQAWYEDRDMAFVYFKVVHKKLSACPYGLNTRVQMHDPSVGMGELVYQHCPTCQLEELRSEECSQRILEASDTLDSEILLELRELLIEANEAALTYVEGRNATILGDIANKMTGTQPGRNSLNVIDRIHLKMMHKEENPQSNTQLDMMRTIAQEMAGAFKTAAQPATVETPTITAEELAEYRELKAKQEAARERMANARASKEKSNESNTESGQ